MARPTLPAAPPDVAEAVVTGGVDTHLDVHVVAALDRIGGLLGTASFPTTPTGYAQLLDWLLSFGPVVQVGVEGTSSYGAGLTRALQAEGVLVVEVDRPNRQKRRRVGKSDTLDAVAAARAALAGEALGLPKSKDGNVEGIRVLGVARTSSIKARTQSMNQLRSLVSTAPAELRERLRTLPIKQIVEVCAGLRPGADSSVETTTKTALRVLARRVQYLDTEIAELDTRRTALVKQVAPDLLEAFGVGPHTAATLLVTVGDNPAAAAQRSELRPAVRRRADPGRQRQERRLPPPAPRRRPTSQQRPVDHRAQPHGDPPRHQGLRRTTHQRGKQTKFIMRCLKRHVAREIFKLLPRQHVALTT